MRRHVETSVENPEKEILGGIIFFVLWVLALLLLSAVGRAQEKPEQTSAAPPSQQTPKAENLGQSPSAAGIAEPEPDPKTTPEQGSEEKDQAQSDSNENQITLARFILISIPDRQLALIDDGQIVKIYPIAVGADDTPSPEGDFIVISRVTNPSWTHEGKVVGPGKDNPVGSRWIGLSLKGYGIHGTNAPRSIGKAASHGCFRMGKKDVEELFKLVRVGDTVAVRAERDQLVAQVFGGNSNAETQVASAAPTATADAGQ